MALPSLRIFAFLVLLWSGFQRITTQETTSHYCQETVQMLQNTTKEVISSKILRYQKCAEAEQDPEMTVLETETENGYCKVRLDKVVLQPVMEMQNVSIRVCCKGWSGEKCDQAVCTQPCLHGSRCVGHNICDCTGTGHVGDDCSQAVCESPCKNGGNCSSPNTCTCPKGYTGLSCERPVCNPACQHGYCMSPDVCVCLNGYVGNSCELVDCGGECFNGGVCNEIGNCECSVGYKGQFCEEPICEIPCNNGGTCVEPNRCSCPPGFSGFSCSINNQIRQNTTDISDELKAESLFDADDYSVCATWGGRHIITFDGVYYYFPGKGTYTLFQECRSTEPSFRVHINQTYSCDPLRTTCDISLKITSFDVIIDILPGGVILENNKRVKIPHQAGELEFSQIANYTVVKGMNDAVILFDGSSSVYTFASRQMMGQLCGLCGLFDGNKTNDFVNYVKKPINNKVDFSNAWLDPMETRDIESVQDEDIHPCLKLRNTNPGRADHVQTSCAILKATYAPFQKCHAAVNPNVYIAMCNRDTCSCLLTKGIVECSSLSCDVAQQYARACNKHGVQLQWRSQTFCSPAPCPVNMEFKECSRNCRRSCGSDSFETECEEFCVDGCFCKNGTLWDYATLSCVERNKCSCYQADKIVPYPPGTFIEVGCESCSCGEAGRWSCIPNDDCPAVCSLSGDPHFKTFDGRQFFFEGECEYVLSQVQGKETDSLDYFAVWIENKYCNKITDGVCTKVITVKIGKNENQKIIRLRGFKIELDSMTIGIPYKDETVVIRKVSSILIRLTTTTGVDVMWDGRTRIYLKLDRKYREKVAGMCGNFNLDVNDDNLTPNGENEFNVTKFALEWKTNTACNSRPSTGYLGACALSKEYQNLAEKICSRFWSEDVIRICNSMVNPTKFVDQCKHDVCMCGRRHGDPRDCECAAFASYARECASKGYIYEWRKTGFCEINCTKGMVYQECGSNCDQTCRGIQPDDCVEECIEGCNCPQGKRFDEESDACVPLSQCKCYYRGNYYESGEIRREQCRECACKEGKWDCQELECKVDELCDGDLIWSNCSDCIRTCDNLNVDCASMCGTQGCKCPNGTVQLDKESNQCIHAQDCPCKHMGIKYKNGQKIRKECNLCYCNHGTWVCTERNCEGTCECFGDPHYVTFDSRAFNFEGTCAYIVAQDFCHDNTGTFQITAENVPCGTLGYSCTKSVKFLIYDTIINLVRGTNITYTANTHAPTGSAAANFTIKELGSYIFVVAHGITLLWDKSMRLTITLQPEYMGRVCGLCGNFDHVANNDFRDKNFYPENSQSPLAFANSWRVRESCATVEVERPSPCVLNPHREAWAVASCQIILSKTFEPCHSFVDPQWYFKACRDDSCACDRGGDCQCFCTAVAAYAARCLRSGICINWREDKTFGTDDICPMQCLPGKDYFPCHSSCPKSCSDLSNLEFSCNTGDIEGCFCPNGTYLQNDKCVPLEQCYCTDLETGQVYKPGAVVVLDCRECTCFKGVFRCQEGPKCKETTQFPGTTKEICVGSDLMFCDNFCATICDGNKECLYGQDEVNCTTEEVEKTTIPITSAMPPFTTSTIAVSSFTPYQPGTGSTTEFMTQPYSTATEIMPTTTECKFPYVETSCEKKCEEVCHSIAHLKDCDPTENHECKPGCDLVPGFAEDIDGPVKESRCHCFDEIKNVTREPYEKWERGCDTCECVNNTVLCTNPCGIVTCPPGLELLTPAGKCCPECRVPVSTLSPTIPETELTMPLSTSEEVESTEMTTEEITEQMTTEETTIRMTTSMFSTEKTTVPECIQTDWMSAENPMLIDDSQIEGFPVGKGTPSDARVNRRGWLISVNNLERPYLVVNLAADNEDPVEVLSQELISNANTYSVSVKEKSTDQWQLISGNIDDESFSPRTTYDFPPGTSIRAIKITLLEPMIATQNLYSAQLILNACVSSLMTTAFSQPSKGMTTTSPMKCNPDEIYDVCRCTPNCDDILSGRGCKVDVNDIDNKGFCCQCPEGMVYNSTGQCMNNNSCVCTDENGDYSHKPHEKFIKKGVECDEECVYTYDCQLDCVHICNIVSCTEGYEKVIYPDKCCSCVPITTILPTTPITTTSNVCSCPPGTFPCHDCSLCLPHHLRCDHVDHCSDGSDEIDCKCIFNGTVHDNDHEWDVNECTHCHCTSGKAVCNKECTITSCPNGTMLDLKENNDECCECVSVFTTSTTPTTEVYTITTESPYKINCSVDAGNLTGEEECISACDINFESCEDVKCYSKVFTKDDVENIITVRPQPDAEAAFADSGAKWKIENATKSHSFEIIADEPVIWVRITLETINVKHIKIFFGSDDNHVKLSSKDLEYIKYGNDVQLTDLVFNEGNGIEAKILEVVFEPTEPNVDMSLFNVEPYFCSEEGKPTTETVTIPIAECVENETHIINECYNKTCFDGKFDKVPACNKKCTNPDETLVTRAGECCQCLIISTPITRSREQTTTRFIGTTQVPLTTTGFTYSTTTEICNPPLEKTDCMKECSLCHYLQPNCTETGTFICRTGCDCPENSVFNGTECVYTGSCFCIADDIIRRPGEVWETECFRYTCFNNTIIKVKDICHTEESSTPPTTCVPGEVEKTVGCNGTNIVCVCINEEMKCVSSDPNSCSKCPNDTVPVLKPDGCCDCQEKGECRELTIMSCDIPCELQPMSCFDYIQMENKNEHNIKISNDCECEPGYKKEKTVGDFMLCVKFSPCKDCFHNGSKYPHGSIFQPTDNDGNIIPCVTCTCLFGNITCKERDCSTTKQPKLSTPYTTMYSTIYPTEVNVTGTTVFSASALYTFGTTAFANQTAPPCYDGCFIDNLGKCMEINQTWDIDPCKNCTCVAPNSVNCEIEICKVECRPPMVEVPVEGECCNVCEEPCTEAFKCDGKCDCPHCSDEKVGCNENISKSTYPEW